MKCWIKLFKRKKEKYLTRLILNEKVINYKCLIIIIFSIIQFEFESINIGFLIIGFFLWRKIINYTKINGHVKLVFGPVHRKNFETSKCCETFRSKSGPRSPAHTNADISKKRWEVLQLAVCSCLSFLR